MKKLSKHLIFWTLFIGVGALFGTAMMWLDTSGAMFGMSPMLPYFQVLPFADCLFQDFAFAGFALLLINGIPQITTAILLIKRHKLAPLAALACGILLMLWICIQFVIFPLNFMSCIYFVFGVAEFILALKLLKKNKKSQI
ncbi:MAG: hypothetical protein LBC89_05935 [Bacteroidales bacterium]|jgi:hypothetical protein|nr:hypothetical protein [Bacteroidales bacterium]